MEYWSQYPPAHLLLRGFIRPGATKSRQLNPAEQQIAMARAVSLASLPPSVRRFVLSKSKEKPQA
jgi:hypothetical protein